MVNGIVRFGSCRLGSMICSDPACGWNPEGGFRNLKWRAAPERLRPSRRLYDSQAIFSGLKAHSSL